MRFYTTTITARFTIEVEAESDAEAERIIDGVLESDPTIHIMENYDRETETADDQLRSNIIDVCKRTDIERVES